MTFYKMVGLFVLISCALEFTSAQNATEVTRRKRELDAIKVYGFPNRRKFRVKEKIYVFYILLNKFSLNQGKTISRFFPFSVKNECFVNDTDKDCSPDVVSLHYPKKLSQCC